MRLCAAHSLTRVESVSFTKFDFGNFNRHNPGLCYVSVLCTRLGCSVDIQTLVVSMQH